MRITVDTNVLVSALGWDGAEAAVIEIVLSGYLKLCLSVPILNEFFQVVRYPKFSFSEEEIDDFVERLLHYSVIVTPTINIDVMLQDPKDKKIIECAVAGDSSYIISGDKHLLELGQYQGIRVLRAPEFLRMI